MKTILIISALLTATMASADHYDNRDVLKCQVSKMFDYRYFQEALSEDEYPYIDVAKSLSGEYTVGIGGNYPYEKSEGDTVVFKSSRKSTTQVLQITIRTQYGDLILLSVASSPATGHQFKGQLRVQEKGDFKAKPIANISCKYKP